MIKIFQLCLKVYCFVFHNVVIYEKNTQKMTQLHVLKHDSPQTSV